MTIVLTLPEELEQRVRQEAERLGLSVDEYTLQILEKHVTQKERRAEAISLLQSWIDAEGEDKEEQKETGEYLIRVLDEDRLSDRKLFPPELKGVSW
jgi:hypothetical protein